MHLSTGAQGSGGPPSGPFGFLVLQPQLGGPPGGFFLKRSISPLRALAAITILRITPNSLIVPNTINISFQ